MIKANCKNNSLEINGKEKEVKLEFKVIFYKLCKDIGIEEMINELIEVLDLIDSEGKEFRKNRN